MPMNDRDQELLQDHFTATAALIALVALLAGCTAGPPRRITYVPVPESAINDYVRDPKLCSMAGGWWTGIGDGREVCVMQTLDSGKECTDDTQCQAYCSAGVGIPGGTKTAGKCAFDKRDMCRVPHVVGGEAQIVCLE